MCELAMPKGAADIIAKLKHDGYDAYIVGGCVRDSLLHRQPKDWDICTSATPSQVLGCFDNRRVIETGLQHGTVTIVMDDGQYEVTTFRIDGDYSDGRHPDTVQFVADVREDLARRDFTMNAMAYNDDVGLVDPFNGYADLMNRTIACVGNADDRFNEDALRIMRAIRFSSVYGFRISEGTNQTILRNVKLLNLISAERINSELCRLLQGREVLRVLLDYPEVITTIIPELAPCVGFDQNNRYHQYTIYDHIAHAVGNYTGHDIVVKVALLLHDIGKPAKYTEDERGGHFYGHGVVSRDLAEGVLTRLRFDTKTKNQVLELVLDHDAVIEPTTKTVKRWLTKLGEEQFSRLLDIRMADILAHAEGTQQSRIERCNALRVIMQAILASQQCFTLKDLAISGHDVLALGIPEGRQVGEALQKALDAVIDGAVDNEKEALARYLTSGGNADGK